MKVSFIYIALICFGFGIPAKMEKKIDKEIASQFETKSFEKELITLDAQIEKTLPLRFNQDNFKKILSNGEVIGYFYFGIAPSKTDVFDYVVIFDKELVVKKIKVLAYREDFGMEIGSKRWLKQFYELKGGDQVKLDKDIKAISGATISVQSMTHAVNQLLESIKIIQDNQLL